MLFPGSKDFFSYLCDGNSLWLYYHSVLLVAVSL
uniref:Uncharacterized protein n=1 Tax=Setaria italica TaxID=4555 RepID=K4AN83_SETIT